MKGIEGARGLIMEAMDTTLIGIVVAHGLKKTVKVIIGAKNKVEKIPVII